MEHIAGAGGNIDKNIYPTPLWINQEPFAGFWLPSKMEGKSEFNPFSLVDLLHFQILLRKEQPHFVNQQKEVRQKCKRKYPKSGPSTERQHIPYPSTAVKGEFLFSTLQTSNRNLCGGVSITHGSQSPIASHFTRLNCESIQE